MQHSSRRNSKRRGAALLAAASVATLFATIAPAEADLGDTASDGVTVDALDPKPFTGGFIRVQPTDGVPATAVADFENQVAPIIYPGLTNQVGANLQVAIPNDFESGDRIVISVFPDGTVNSSGPLPLDRRDVIGTAGNGNNCQNAPTSIGYSAVPAVAVSGPYDSLASTWASDGSAQPTTGAEAIDAGGDNILGETGEAVLAGTATPPPTAVATLQSSTQCAPQTVTDRIVLTLSNLSTRPVGSAALNDYFVITLSGIQYNVGSLVAPGPIHNVPFGQQGLSASVYQDVPLFASNDSEEFNDLFAGATVGGNAENESDGVVGFDALLWTNGAYVAPISLAATGTSIVADSTVQPIGSIVLGEIATDGLQSDTYTVSVLTGGVTCDIDLAGTPAVAITNNTVGTTAATGTASVTTTVPGDPDTCGFILTLTGMNDSTAGTVTISGLVGATSVQGNMVVTITNTTSALSPKRYLTPDDQWQGGSNEYSDVNPQTTLAVPFTVAVPVAGRVGGQDRFETSAKIAQLVAPCTEWAIVASGVNFPDALSANYLAGSIDRDIPTDVPVLLVNTDGIPASIAAYLATAGVKHVIIVGGPAAVSTGVEFTLTHTLATRCTGDSAIDSTQPVQGQVLDVQRYGGLDRYDTNRMVVNAASAIDPFDTAAFVQTEFLSPAKKTAIVATGTNFADALAAGPLAYDGYPLVLTEGTALSADAASALTNNDITQVLLVGGPAAVSPAVQTAIEALGITTFRIAGVDRFATATAIADFIRALPASGSVAGTYDGNSRPSLFTAVWLANGNNFPDALSGGPLGGSDLTPIVLTDAAPLSANTQSWLVLKKANLTSVAALGLGVAITTATLAAANTAIS